MAKAPTAVFAVAPPVPDRDTNAPPQFASHFIDPNFLTPSVHVASLCEISGGRMLAAWYGVAVAQAVNSPAAKASKSVLMRRSPVSLA